ncbi:MAG: DUF3467 domain-containing protein [Candidatus Omnitrophota bacterium]
MAILYSDKVIIGRTSVGFVFNFATNKIEGASSEEVVSQVAMSPEFAKVFLAHLYSEIAKFEAACGEIKMPVASIIELKSIAKPPIGFK